MYIASIGFVHFSYARLYTRTGDFDLAEMHTTKATKYADTLNSTYLKESLYGFLPIIYASQGHLTQAIDQYDRFSEFADSVNLSEARVLNRELELIHDLELKELEATFKGSELNHSGQYEHLKRVSSYGGASLIVIVIVLLFVSVAQKRKIRRIGLGDQF